MSDETNPGTRTPSAVGFIGLGNMGWWMALNMRKGLPKSTKLYIYDIIPTTLEYFADNARTHDLGEVIICKSSREVAKNADVTFTVVPAGSHVREVFLDPDYGLLAGPIEDKTFVDCSTIDPATSLAVAEAVVEASPSAHFYDAPVSGGVSGAEAGTLSFLIGASDEDIYMQQTLKPLLETMGKNFFCIGAPSLGLVAKLCNNYLSGICAIATSEAMNIGMRHGIDPKLLSNVFKNSTGGNWQNANMNPVPGVCPNAVTSKGYKGGFKVQMMVKDMTLALNAAKEVDAKLALGDSALATYKATAEDPRCEDLDNRVVYRWLGGRE